MGRTGPNTTTITSTVVCGVIGLTAAVTLISSSLISPYASADTPSSCVLRWGIVDTPGGYLQRNDIRPTCEINALAVSQDGRVIYALDIPNARTGLSVKAGIWRSDDGGASWSPRPTEWLAQALPTPVFPVTDIAMSPEDPDFIAVVCMDAAGTHRRQVYLSEDGGTNWVYGGPIPWLYGPGEQAGSIAVSAPYIYRGAPVHDIIIGSRNPADGLAQGEVYILRYPGLAGWKAQGFGGGDIIALLPSPAYPADSSLVVMSSTTQRTYINLGYRDIDANNSSWNQYSRWPVELCAPDQAGGIGSGQNRVVTGSLSLPADFDGSSNGRRVIFASYDSNGTAMGTSQRLDDVYRLDDCGVTRLKVPGYGNSPRICSIAYSGTCTSGKLLAGGVTANPATAEATVWFTADPLALCPTWVKPLKAPTGGRYASGCANALIAWSQAGEAAFCATGSGNRSTPLEWSDPTGLPWGSQSLDESAFSLSLDNGASWNQLGLIDTQIDHFDSLAAAPDGTTLYISSVNSKGLDSTWRSRTALIGDARQRVLCLDCPSPLLELSPEHKYGSVLYLGNGGSDRLAQSRDSGQTWQYCFPGVLLQDMAAQGDDALFVLKADGLVRYGLYTSRGWRWGSFTDTKLTLAHTIDVQKSNVLVGAGMGQHCPAAYSSDGGETWNLITESAYSFGNKHVALDDEFKDNHLFYLADDAGGLYRWAIGSSARWEDMAPTYNSYYGVCSAGRGTLYSAFNPLTTAGVDRTLYSRAGIPKGGMSWDPLTVGLPAGVLFKTEPVAITCADETVWAIDSRAYDPVAGIGRLWAFRDTLTIHTPWLLAPKAGSIVPCDPVTGRNAQVDLKWEQLSLADAYEIEVAKDNWFDLVVENASPSTNPFYVPEDVRYPAYYIPDGRLPEAGSSYYWHVRVRRAVTGQVIRSRWSYGMAFSVRPGFPVAAPSYPGIQALAPSHQGDTVPVYPLAFSWTPMQGTTAYRFLLAGDAMLKNPLVDQTVKTTAYNYGLRLDYGKAYFWQVIPLEPVPGDPSPVFSFITEGRAVPAVQPGPSTDNTTNGLLVTLIFVILFGMSVQVIIFRRKG